MRFRNCFALSALAAAIVMTHFIDAQAADQTPPEGKQIRVGIIGLDTSHVAAFTAAINKPDARPELRTLRIVAAFPGGSPDLPTSWDRVKGFTETVQKQGVEIVDSIDALLPKVDAVLLESVDGRPHLEQVKPVIRAHKPVFIDKPVAASLADTLEIFRLAKEAGVPCFSSSSLRFSPEVLAMRTNPPVGQVLGCDTYSPCSLDKTVPDLFWYGIHGVEMMYTIMQPGCVSVTRVHSPDTDLATGTWKDGRVATYRGLRASPKQYGAMVFGTKANMHLPQPEGGKQPASVKVSYEPMLVEIAKFFETGKPPVSADETIEIVAFMEAADESKRLGGAPVTLASMLERARTQNAQRSSQ
ncbi:MAG TPA: Gfo/Idh/MocA family oxidoreductase [Pirellulales bacterium]|jgi:predicted dehydrogenase|nr:Gfo/Idh/MocA family oxidoreductase [Pirellulales bacterium]